MFVGVVQARIATASAANIIAAGTHDATTVDERQERGLVDRLKIIPFGR